MTDKYKILIAEIADNIPWNDFFPAYSGVWAVRTNNDYTGLAASDFELENIGFTDDINVLSVTVANLVYTSVDSISEVINNSSSFYYNDTDRTLYIHFSDHNSPYQYDISQIKVGLVLGFYYSNADIDNIFNGQLYEPRLISIPILEDKKDSQFYQKQIFQDGKVEIENSDYKYVRFSIGYGVRPRAGSFVRTLVWTGDDPYNIDYDNDLVTTYQGYIENVTEGTKLVLNLRDIRKSLDKKTVVNTLDTSNFPYLDDSEEEIYKPQLWGRGYRIPCRCLNPNANDSFANVDYKFMICDIERHNIPLAAINNIWIAGKKVDVTTDPEISSIPNVQYDTLNKIAYFELPYESFRRFDGTDARFEDMDKIEIDSKGYIFDGAFRNSSFRILRQILQDEYGYNYTSTYYDIDTWDKYESTSYTIGLYLDQPTTVSEIIEMIQNTNLGRFIWTPDLKFSWDNDDFDGYKAIIENHEFLPSDYVLNFSQDITEVLASVRVGFAKNYGRDRYWYYTDDSNKTNARLNYDTEKQKDFKTLIRIGAKNLHAVDFAERVKSIADDAKVTFSIKVPFEYYNLKSGEWIIVHADMPDFEVLGYVGCQIQLVKPNIDDWTVSLTLRIYDYLPNTFYLDESGKFYTDRDNKLYKE